jgi:type IV pilus assembly protein PilA
MHATFDRLRERRRSEEGFTLIELLVVVVIIGILVAIAVPVYLNYRQGAADKSAQSDVRGAISAVEQFYTDNGNQYPASAATAAPGQNITLPAIQTGANSQTITVSAGTTLRVNVASTSYAVCATNSGGTKYWKYRNGAGGTVSAVSQTDYNACSATS